MSFRIQEVALSLVMMSSALPLLALAVFFFFDHRNGGGVFRWLAALPFVGIALLAFAGGVFILTQTFKVQG